MSEKRRLSDARALRAVQTRRNDCNSTTNTYDRRSRIAWQCAHRVLEKMNLSADAVNVPKMVEAIGVQCGKAKFAGMDANKVAPKMCGEISKLRFVLDCLSPEDLISKLAAHEFNSSLVLLNMVADSTGANALDPNEYMLFAMECKATFRRLCSSGVRGKDLLEQVTEAMREFQPGP